MKNKMNSFYKSMLIAALFICSCVFQAQADVVVDKGVVGKVITGYQGWFNFSGDGTPLSWRHWFGTSPNPHGITFEVYPDIREYNDRDMAVIPASRGLGKLGDGRDAKLFSSFKEDVIDTHVKWMQEYEIDGTALQRFMSYTTDNRKAPSDSIAVRLARATVKYDRLFYIMWDMGASDTDVARLKTDWAHLRDNLKLTDYSSYAHQDGKPVVCIWGVGQSGRTDSPANWLEMITWLQSEGCYVIGGVARGWRTLNTGAHSDPAYVEVYKALDMVSPWWVGAIRMNSIAAHETNWLKPDLAYCQANGMEFQPVIFPGFAWSQWRTGNTVNDFPRHEGRFAWEQFKLVQNNGIKNLYLAMFDEYDEGTNWMKMATDFTEIPVNQYFKTTSTDGYWLSSDFQLRVAQQMSRVMKGEEEFTSNLPIPHSLGPVYYRNSFEKRENALTNIGAHRLDPCFLNHGQVSQVNVGDRSATEVVSNLAKTGKYLAKFTGTPRDANPTSFYYKFGDVKIEVKEDMKLIFWKYAVNELGLNTTVSLRFDDDSFLHTTDLKDEAGIGVNPSNPRGTVGTWTQHEIVIGKGDLIGKTINGVLFGYEGTSASNFDAYFDDILIMTGTTDATGVSLNKSTLSLKEGETEQLAAIITPSNATNQVVAWKSDDTSVATVDDGGIVTAVTVGEAIITATTEDGNYKASCEVTVEEGVNILSPNSDKSGVRIYPAMVEDGLITFDTRHAKDDGLLTVSLITIQGGVVQKEYISPKTVKTLVVNLPQGVYIVSVSGNETNVKSKLIIK
jgi:hypothetical protein